MITEQEVTELTHLLFTKSKAKSSRAQKVIQPDRQNHKYAP
jgi:hypothetical protein